MKIFYSYSHKDEKYRKQLENFLSTLRDEGKITEWSDREINPGDNLNQQIDKNLQAADIVILLVSQDFISSEACKYELNYAIDNNKITVPIILSPCTWQDTKLKNILALPTDGKPIKSWATKDEAWLNVFDGIKNIIDSDKKKRLVAKSEFIDKLNEVVFISSRKEDFTLSDIYVKPKMHFISLDGKETSEYFELNDFIKKENSKCLIKGIELSGKSSLLRYIYINSLKHNYLPIIMDGDFIKKRVRFEDYLETELTNQYENLNIDDFQKLDRRILLVDNYTHKISDNFIEWAENNFEYVYVAIDTEEQMIFFKDNKIFVDYNQATIKGFKRYERYELIKNWISLDKHNSSEDEVIEKEIENLERHVNSIILDRNILPNTPFYILTILQSYESFMPENIQITAYGHCYHAIIVAHIINSGIANGDVDSCLNFLTYISRYMYDNSNNISGEITNDIFLKGKKDYSEEYLISNSALERLTASSLFKKTDNKISFAYPFIYYFFLGKNLATNQDKNLLRNLCDKIYLKNNANILIFTIHHSITTDLLDIIFDYCTKSFSDRKAIELSVEDTNFMTDLVTDISDNIKFNNSHEKNNEDIRKQQDLAEEENDQIIPDIDEASNEGVKELEKAIKIIEVLGQIIKNRYGSFPKKKIRELILATENLSLRILSVSLETLKDKDFKDWIGERIDVIEKNNGHNLEQKQIKKIVEQNIQVMGYVLIIGIFQKTFYSIAIDKLQDVQKDLSDEQNTIAFDFYQILFNMTFSKLNFNTVQTYYHKFYDLKNNWAQSILKILVNNYLDTYNVDYKLRQKLSELLNIEYKPNKPLLK